MMLAGWSNEPEKTKISVRGSLHPVRRSPPRSIEGE
jgi:hypothetical protein